MAQQNINIGTVANDGTGDDLRVAMQKVNDNFTELYGASPVTAQITISGNEISSNATNANLKLTASGTGVIEFEGVQIRDNHIEATRSNDDLVLSASGTGDIVAGAIRIHGTTISSDDSTKITINEAVDITGAVNLSSTLTVGSIANNGGAVEILNIDTNFISSTDSTAITIGDLLAMQANIDMNGNKITSLGTPTADNDAVTKSYVDTQVVGASSLTVVGDDSTGTTFNSGETIKFTGSGNATVTVSGDVVTINSTAAIDPITFVGDDSTGTAVDVGETFKFAGATNITTAVSGDTLTITGPDLSTYTQNSDTALTIVGDDSTGVAFRVGETVKFQGSGGATVAVSGDTVTITAGGGGAGGAITFVGDDSTGTAVNTGETIKIAGSGNATTAVSGDTLTVTVGTTLNVNSLSSSDSSAIQINDGMNISGTLSANTIDTNVISSSDSTAIQINDSVNISGTLTVPTLTVSTISAPASLTGTYTISSPTTITLDPTDEIINDAPMKLVNKTVAQLGSLVSSVGSVVFCTNESGGAQPAFYDGANWRRFTDRAVVS